MDTVSRETRSRVMARVRSHGNKSTELRLRGALVRAGVRGWKVNPGGIEGKPDFVFSREHLLVFVDGCFWHGCPRCHRPPSSNRAYWTKKVLRNRNRDLAVSDHLKRAGWHVIRVWEHELVQTDVVVRRISSRLNRPIRQSAR